MGMADAINLVLFSLLIRLVLFKKLQPLYNYKLYTKRLFRFSGGKLFKFLKNYEWYERHCSS